MDKRWLWTWVAVLSLAVGTAFAADTPELALVADAGNAGKKVPFKDIHDAYPRGGVDHPFRIGVTEVTNAQYAAFLNRRAVDVDRLRLFDRRMDIVRDDDVFTPVAGKEQDGAAFVSRLSAARYCNWLTTGDPEKGAYVVADRVRENGEVHGAIVGYRDLTFPEAARVYFLPDMHEFFKAGWYDPQTGAFREYDAATRADRSAYGLVDVAGGVREWMENKYYAGSTFALGASGDTDDREDLNAVTVHQRAEYEGHEHTGFRVAATAPLQIGDRLNRHNNFFFDHDTPALLRVRRDGAAGRQRIDLELRDFADRPVWRKTIEPELALGVTEIPVELPDADGYYQLRVTPDDAAFGGVASVLPLAVMREAMPERGADGAFGLTSHITRRERRYSFEEFDFELLKRLGVSNVRVDVAFHDNDGNQSVLRRIRAAGLNPLAIITWIGASDYAEMERLAGEHPEWIERWTARGVPRTLAYYAENVFQLVSAHKDVVRDWEFGNEPTYWRIHAEDYAQALKAGHLAAKLADPTANVMAGDLNAIHAPVFEAGGGAFMDSTATHIYGFYVPAFWGIAGKMRELNGWKTAAGVADKPTWITEIGGCTYNHMHMIPVRSLDEVRRYQAIHQPKVMAGGLAFGAAKVLPYNFRDVPVDSLEEEFGMIDRFGFPKPAVASYRTTARLLGDATFIGFLEGHSFEVGRDAGLLFRDAAGREVLAVWRNDPYGHGDFGIPFLDMVRPPAPLSLPVDGGEVECFNLSGGRSVLKAENGAVRVPVSEYPIFVRGRLRAKTSAVATAHPTPKIEVPSLATRILPTHPTRACDLMTGTELAFTAGAKETVEVRVYNHGDRPRSGTLRLTPKSSWREWPWKVDPMRMALEIPPNGMATACFTVPAPEGAKSDHVFFIDAVFSATDGGETRDTAIFRVNPREFALKDWITYAQGYNLALAEDKTQLEIRWKPQHAGYASLYRRSPTPIAADEVALRAADIVVPFMAGRTGLHAVNALFMDAGGEIFQIRHAVAAKDEKWITHRFAPADILAEGVIVHQGGDGKVDFPVRLLGFNFEPKDEADDGFIRVKEYELAKPAARWEPGAWTVYGEGFKMEESADGSELVVTRTPTGRAYASLFRTRPWIIAKNADEWPTTARVEFIPWGAAINAVSILMEDANGEIFQRKQNRHDEPGQRHISIFKLSNFPVAGDLIVYGGDNNRTIDYPAKLLGFNFDFDKAEPSIKLTVNAPTFKARVENNVLLEGGGGAANN